jgi:hypothetical protein
MERDNIVAITESRKTQMKINKIVMNISVLILSTAAALPATINYASFAGDNVTGFGFTGYQGLAAVWGSWLLANLIVSAIIWTRGQPTVIEDQLRDMAIEESLTGEVHHADYLSGLADLIATPAPIQDLINDAVANLPQLAHDDTSDDGTDMLEVDAEIARLVNELVEISPITLKSVVPPTGIDATVPSTTALAVINPAMEAEVTRLTDSIIRSAMLASDPIVNGQLTFVIPEMHQLFASRRDLQPIVLPVQRQAVTVHRIISVGVDTTDEATNASTETAPEAETMVA